MRAAEWFGYKAPKEERTEPGLCEDYKPECEALAAKGRCQADPAGMVRTMAVAGGRLGAAGGLGRMELMGG